MVLMWSSMMAEGAPTTTLRSELLGSKRRLRIPKV